MKTITGTVFIILFFISNAISQNPFTKRYDISGYASAPNTVIQTPDHGYLILTALADTISSHSYSALIKTDSTGQAIWIHGFTDHTILIGAQVYTRMKFTSDTGCILIGYTALGDVRINRFDKSGNTLWSKRYYNVADEGGEDIIQTASGRFVFVSGTGDKGLGITYLDANGDIIWTKSYRPTSANYSINPRPQILELPGGDLLTSWSSSWNQATQMMRTDSLGNVIWLKWYSAAVSFYPFGFYLHPMSTAIDTITNQVVSAEDFGIFGIMLRKFDLNGNTIWLKNYQDTIDFGDIITNNVAIAPDHGFLVSGVATPRNQNYHERMFIMKTDSSGAFEWFRTLPFFAYNGYNYEHLLANYDSNGDIIICGTDTSGGTSSTSMMIYGALFGRADDQGHLNCGDVYFPLSQPQVTWNQGAFVNVYIDTLLLDSAGPLTNFTLPIPITNEVCIGVPASVNENFQSGQAELFPNPSSDFMTLRLPSGFDQGRVFVYDISGKQVMSLLIASNEEKIPVSQLSSGVYFIEIISNAKIWHKKFIVD